MYCSLYFSTVTPFPLLDKTEYRLPKLNLQNPLEKMHIWPFFQIKPIYSEYQLFADPIVVADLPMHRLLKS